MVEEAARFFYGHRVYMDLPRKHKITISACPAQCDMPEINCIALIGVVLDGREGFAMRVGGGLSTVPRLARDLGVWVPSEEALDVMRTLLDVWREDRRYRISRVKARMKFMVDDYGVEAIRAEVERRLGHALTDLPAPEPIVLAGVPEAQLDEVLGFLAEVGLPADSNRLHATAIACTGEPHCNFAVTETKGKLRDVVAHLVARWGDRLDGFRLNLDGCPHACALHWLGDVGLMGTTARETVNGTRQAYDLFLRGGVGVEQAVGRPLVRRVPSVRVEETLDRLLEAWFAGRTDGESFRDFWIRTPDEDLVAVAAGPSGAEPSESEVA